MSGFVTNLDMFMALKAFGSLKNSTLLYQKLSEYLPAEISAEDLKIFKVFVQSYVGNLKKRWSDVSRNQKRFFEKHLDWLDTEIKWPECTSVNLSAIFIPENENEVEEDLNLSLDIVETIPSSSNAATNTPTPRKSFEDLTNQQKKRRSGSLLENSEEELAFALIMKLKEIGNSKLARIIEYLSKNPIKTHEVTDFLFKSPKAQKSKLLSNEKTLSLVTALSLSKWQYLTMRSFFHELPSYQNLLASKKTCYPTEDAITVTENGANIKLQSLLDLTTEKIIKVVETDINSNATCLKLISKWGFDGASSQSMYKQKTSSDLSDSSVFMTSLVPLRLMNGDELVWENPHPSSTNYCRPKKFEFVKETKEYIQQQATLMEEEITNLVPTRIRGVEIYHDLHMTMIDGKVSSALSETPSCASCTICKCTPKDMNNLSLVYSKPVNTEMYRYGLSSLHMWIRCMECLLHISYNMDFKKWAARGQDKLLQKSSKELTQNEFFTQTGLLVDIVKQGYGTTNDGNTARRFFRNYEKSAEITGVDESLIKRFAVILQTISSGRKINIEEFRQYCKETAELYVHLYIWYYMPASVHKLLVHGADICENFSFMPIGMMSEEASEARNKDFRNIRERHSRKTGRIQTNEDIIHNFLISSDPYISHIKPKFLKSQKLQLFPETESLLVDESLDQYEPFELEEDEVFIELENCPPPDPLA